MGAEPARCLGHIIVVGEDRAGVTYGTEVLSRIEAERRRVAVRAGAASPVHGSCGLRRVLEHRQAARAGEGGQLLHRRRVAEQVHRDQGSRALGEHRFDRGRGHTVSLGVDIREHRPRAGVDHGPSGGEEADPGDDHLVAGPDPERSQCDRQRLGAVGDSDAVAATDEGGELGLERLHLGTEDVAARLEHGPLALGDQRHQRLQRRSGGEQRNRGPGTPCRSRYRHRSITSSSGTLRIWRAGTPTTTARGGTSRTTTAPAPTNASSPISTPGQRTAPPPIRHALRRVGPDPQFALRMPRHRVVVGRDHARARRTRRPRPPCGR